MARKLLEIAKSILIVLLVLAIVVLTLLALPAKTITSTPWLAAILRPVAPLFGLSQSELTYTGEPVGTEIHGAAQPVAISVCNEAGRMSAQYDFAALDTLYEQLGGYLAQALDSAQAAEPVSRQTLTDALSGSSIAFCYPAATRPAVAAAWLNASAPDLPESQWFVLSAEDGAVYLYLSGTACARSRTGLPAAQLESAVDIYQPDGSFFAFENASYARAAALSLVCPSAQPADAVTVNPCEARFVSALASSLGFNPYGDAKYVDPSGTTSFTETTHALSVTAGGRIQLQVFEPMERFTAASDSLEGRIETARELLAAISGSALGEARLYLTAAQEQDGQTVCEFSYYLAGVRVSAIEPARVTFTGSRVTQVSLTLRTCQLTAERPALLPPAQAAAILRAGQLLTLRYVEQSEGVLTPAWKG